MAQWPSQWLSSIPAQKCYQHSDVLSEEVLGWQHSLERPHYLHHFSQSCARLVDHFPCQDCEDPGLQENCEQNCSQTLAAAYYQNKTLKCLGTHPYTYDPWYVHETPLSFYSRRQIVEACPLGTVTVNSCTLRIWGCPKIIVLNLSQGSLSVQVSLSMGRTQKIFKASHQPSGRDHHSILHIYSESGHQTRSSHC